MSGYGIDVTKMMQSAGWTAKKATRHLSLEEDSMTWIAGPVVIAGSDADVLQGYHE
jgi:hypothetical protein